jgi:quercetin dioxygenase-like cupin family protein
MGGVRAVDFDAPDETRTPDKTRVDVVDVGGAKVARTSLEPGWRWSECIKPVAVVRSGRMQVQHDDGTTAELGPGDTYVIEPGHDAWVLGDEPFVGLEFEQRAAEQFARAKED